MLCVPHSRVPFVLLVLLLAPLLVPLTGCMDTPDRTGDPRTDLRSADDTVKVQAALAAARSRNPALIPPLIDLLEDDERVVRLNAHIALGVLSNQKQFGYFYLHPAKERAAAVRRYREWYEATGGVDPPAGTAESAAPTP